MAQGEYWLNKERLTVYPRIVLTMFSLITVGWFLLSKNMLTFDGEPLGYDFLTFWAASRIGLTDDPQNAYNLQMMFAAENQVIPAMNSMFAWFYPPSFYLLILPLSWLPYLTAYFVFMLTTLAAYVGVFRAVIKTRDSMILLAGFPGVWINVFHGQNAFLTAALAAAALLCLERYPILAGVFVGLLAIKPHLAVLFPVALIAIGAWSTFITAGLVAVTFMAVGTAVLGTDTWYSFLESLTFARKAVETGALPWIKMPTLFASLRMMGASVSMAYLGHAIGACGAIWAMWLVWRRTSEWPLRGAALMSATFLVSPYLYDYDLAWLAFPIAWMSLNGMKYGWLRGEREVLVAAWVLPMVMVAIAMIVPIPLGPLVLATMLWMVVRRVLTVQMTPV